MTSWRATTPQLVQDDLDHLLGAALDTAQDLLTRNGEFFPFAVTLDADGHTALAAAGVELGERPASTDVLDELYAATAADAGRLRAVAVVADVVADGADAVRVEAEHRDGGPGLEVLAPYRRRGLLRKTVEYGELRAGPGLRRTWPAPEGP